MARRKASYTFTEISELEREYKTLAKTADDRLRALEKYAAKTGDTQVFEYAYHVAVDRMIRKYSGDGAKRFSRKIPGDITKNPADYINTLERKMRDIKQFLSMPTSVVKVTKSTKYVSKGIQDVYMKRANTIQKRYGVYVSWGDVAVLFQNEYFKKLANKVGSKTALRQIATLQKSKDDVINAVKESNEKTFVIDGKHLRRATRSLLADYPDEVKKLLKLE